MEIKLLDYSELKDFPRGSAIAILDEKLYIVSSDGAYLVVLSKNWKVQDTISISAPDPQQLLYPSLKAFYAATIVSENKMPSLLIPGSGAADIGAELAYIINLKSKERREINLSSFYARIRESGIETVNITALVRLGDKMILCNSSDNIAIDNCLLVTSADFWKNPNDAEIKQIRLQQEDDKAFVQLTSVTYSYENDWLIVTGSARKRSNKLGIPSVDEYFVGVVEDGSRKSDRKRIKLNDIFELGLEDDIFNGQDIRSICLQADKKRKLKLHMIASDDAGKRTLFKIRLKDGN